MCGIGGWWSAGVTFETRMVRAEMASKAMRSRGPDHEGIQPIPQSSLVLVHRRLKILDLSERSNQPMHHQLTRDWLVYNGEIYNFHTLKEHLLEEGISFETTGDTEVLLKYLSAYGITRTLQQLDGMFAFAFYRSSTQELFLARDRFGEKPLCYALGNEGFCFASDLRALRAFMSESPSMDPTALQYYIRYSFIPVPRTLFVNVHKLPAGHWLRFCPNQPLETNQYWSPQSSSPVSSSREFEMPVSEALQQFTRHFSISVQRRMISDVPIGVLLSGGIDSSLVATYAQAASTQPIQTYTIASGHKELDESEDAFRIARHLGTNHTTIAIEEIQLLDLVQSISDAYDEPFADSSQLPMLLISREIRKNVTVALSGDGGDELFGGYYRHVWCHFIASFHCLPFWFRKNFLALFGSLNDCAPHGILFSALKTPQLNHKLNKFIRALNTRQFDHSYFEILASEHSYLKSTAFQILPMPVPEFGTLSSTEQWMILDLLFYMQNDILVKTDRASMSQSLEIRTPFLFKELYEFAQRLPLKLKINGFEGKWLLKQALGQHLPESLYRRPKKGFAIPVAELLKGTLKAWAQDLIENPSPHLLEWIDSRKVQQYWRTHLTGKTDHHVVLWNYLMLQQWIMKHL